MYKAVIIGVLLYLSTIIVLAQAKIEFWGKFPQNGLHRIDWAFDNYEGLFLQDSVLYTSLLQEGYISKINLNDKRVVSKFFPLPALKNRGVYMNSTGFVPYKDGFLAVYFNSIYFFDKFGRKLFFKSEEQETIEQILLAGSNNLILHCTGIDGAKVYHLNKDGGIIDKLTFDFSYIPGFKWYNFNDELISEFLDVKVESNRLSKLKKKQYKLLEKSEEHVVGYYKNVFFLYSKKIPNELIIRNSETFAKIGEVILPEEMVKLIKRSRSFKETMEYMPIIRVISLNNKQHIVVFSSSGNLYVYSVMRE